MYCSMQTFWHVSKNELFLLLCLWINISELGILTINPYSIDRWSERGKKKKKQLKKHLVKNYKYF